MQHYYIEPGSSPAEFIGVPVGSRSIMLNWSIPVKPNGVITQYRLQCSGGRKMFSPVLNGSQTTTTLSGLLPYTNYSCSITAHTSVGGGPAATTSVVTDEESE